MALTGAPLMAKRKPNLVWGPKGAWVLPKALMEHPDFRELPPSAMKVLMVLGCQYNGRNNGDLAATEKMLKDWDGMAKGTLAKALRELRERRIIYKTRVHQRGVDGAKPALYALSWLVIDPCPEKQLDEVSYVQRSLR